MKLGIMQGRLSLPVGGAIQEFPKDMWKREFDIIHELGLNHIDWIITKKSFNDGVLDMDINPYSKCISSICCDNLIDEKIIDSNFLNLNLRPVCNWAIKNNIGNITIPLLEKSKVTYKNKNNLFDTLFNFASEYKGINFHFEMESDIDVCIELVSMASNLFLVYDTGNITSCGFDHEMWITKGIEYIKNIHLKDRTILPVKTVEPFTGDTNFDKIFGILKKNNYIGIYTIQTARGIDGDEINTILRHKEKFIKLYNEKFI